MAEDRRRPTLAEIAIGYDDTVINELMQQAAERIATTWWTTTETILNERITPQTLRAARDMMWASIGLPLKPKPKSKTHGRKV